MPKIDILYVFETWFNEKLISCIICPTLNFFRCTKLIKEEGAWLYTLGTFIAATVVSKTCMTSSVIAVVFIEFKWGSTKYLFGSIYRPPCSNCLQFLEELNEVLQRIAARFGNHLICISGDMNINMLQNVTGNHVVQNYLHLMYSYGLLS